MKPAHPAKSDQHILKGPVTIPDSGSPQEADYPYLLATPTPLWGCRFPALYGFRNAWLPRLLVWSVWPLIAVSAITAYDNLTGVMPRTMPTGLFVLLINIWGAYYWFGKRLHDGKTPVPPHLEHRIVARHSMLTSGLVLAICVAVLAGSILRAL
jgi:hypothetical protein